MSLLGGFIDSLGNRTMLKPIVDSIPIISHMIQIIVVRGCKATNAAHLVDRGLVRDIVVFGMIWTAFPFANLWRTQQQRAQLKDIAVCIDVNCGVLLILNVFCWS